MMQADHALVIADYERICNCGFRCMIITSMTAKNPIRRYARCKRFDKPRGCNFFEWVDDSLYNRVRSSVVGLMLKNETLLAKNEERMKQLKDCLLYTSDAADE